MIVALTHRLLDVHPDDIISDYLHSNQAWNFDLHRGFVASWIGEEIGRAPEPAGVRAVMEVDPTYLDAALAAIEAQSGSLDAYFETVLA
jgi:protein tyrosine/serine phosphatase